MVPVPPVSFGVGGGAAAVSATAQTSRARDFMEASVYYYVSDAALSGSQSVVDSGNGRTRSFCISPASTTSSRRQMWQR